MKETNLSSLKAKIMFFRTLYAVLFIASLIMIVLKSPAILFAVSLGSAVLIRLFIANPLTEKYNVALVEKANQERKEERDIILKKIESVTNG